MAAFRSVLNDEQWTKFEAMQTTKARKPAN